MVKRSKFRKSENYKAKRKKRMDAKNKKLKRLFRPIPQFKSHHFCVRGYLHIKTGLPCQDTSDAILKENYCLAVIADGHGSPQYFRSDRGSRFAVDTFKQCVEEALKAAEYRHHKDDSSKENTSINLVDALTKPRLSKKRRDQIIQQFCQSILVNWRDAVQNDMQTEPFSEEEIQKIPEKYRNTKQEYISAYGSTLVAALLVADFCLLIQIGDGVCVVFDDDFPDITSSLNPSHKYVHGKLFSFEPIPLDEKCFLNTTTSLCDAKANNEFHCCMLKKLPLAVLVSSDGIEDCFHDRQDLHKFFHRILFDFCDSHEEGEAEMALNEFLPRLSEKGSGDDMSLSMFYDIERFKALTSDAKDKAVSD